MFDWLFYIGIFSTFLLASLVLGLSVQEKRYKEKLRNLKNPQEDLYE